MIVLGLTGSIGMGKSTAADMLRKIGVPVFDSDLSVHEALKAGGKGFEEVAVTFPESWKKKTRTIDRTILGQIVFQDVEKKRQLEQILHPLVQAEQKIFLRGEQAKGMDMAVLDIPLLFEIGAESRVDYTVCVSAPYFIQRRRVLSRPGMTEEKFEAILARQLPDAEKRARADYVVQTGLGRALTFRQLKNIVTSLRKAR